jgi:hypothetical protein
LQGLDGLRLGRLRGWLYLLGLRRLGLGDSLGLLGGDQYLLYQGLHRLDYRLDLLNRQDLLDGLYVLEGGLLLLHGLDRLDRLLKILGYLLLGGALDQGRILGGRLDLDYHRVLGGGLVSGVGGDDLGIGTGSSPAGQGVGIGFRPVRGIPGLAIAARGLYQDRGGSLLQHVQHLGRRLGKIDDPGRNKGPPVIYLYIDLSAVVQICNRQHGPKGQGGVGGGIQGGVEDLAGSRGASVEFPPVPGGDPLLPETGKIRRGELLGSTEGGDKRQRGKEKADPFHTPIIGENGEYSLDISFPGGYVLL